MHFVLTTATQTYQKHLLENEYPIDTIDNTMKITVHHRKRFTSQQNKRMLQLQ
jgi:hypothetical protein